MKFTHRRALGAGLLALALSWTTQHVVAADAVAQSSVQVAATNPCAAKATNPCAAKAANPCAPGGTSGAAVNPCAAKQ